MTIKMDSGQAIELKHRLQPQALALVEKATGKETPEVVSALLEACLLLEANAQSNSPIVALEQDVHCETGTYHLSVRRLSTSVPVGKFQILISQNLASGLIH